MEIDNIIPEDFLIKGYELLEELDKNCKIEEEHVNFYITALSYLNIRYNELKKNNYTIANIANNYLKIKELPKFYYGIIANSNKNVNNFTKKDLESLKNILEDEKEENKDIKALNKLIKTKIREFDKEKNYNNNKQQNEIIIKYKINKKEDKVRLFGDRFIENNYFNCNIIYEGI